MSGTLFDAGLQPERTLLAWQRTCLAVAVGVAVGARLTLPVLGALAVVLGLAGLVLVALAWLGARGRYRRAVRELTGPHGALGQGGLPIAAVAGATAAFAIAGAAFVLLAGWTLR